MAAPQSCAFLNKNAFLKIHIFGTRARILCKQSFYDITSTQKCFPTGGVVNGKRAFQLLGGVIGGACVLSPMCVNLPVAINSFYTERESLSNVTLE